MGTNGGGEEAKPDPFASLRQFTDSGKYAKAKPAKQRRRRRRPRCKSPYLGLSYEHYDRLWALGMSSPLHHLMRVLDELAYAPGGKHAKLTPDGRYQVELTPEALAPFGLEPRVAHRELRKLETAELTIIERRSGRCLLVTPLWRTVPAG
jgi:hypothetical protein